MPLKLPRERDRLPPGSHQHLERTGHLPPGLEKKLVVNEPLPPDSQHSLHNGDAVLVDPKTQAVLDVVHEVLTLTGH